MTKKQKMTDHIFIGIKRTIPVIVAFSILLALSEYNAVFVRLSEIVYMFIVPVLVVNIMYSKHKYNYIVVGIFVGYVTYTLSIGILGAIIAGLLLLLLIEVITSYVFDDQHLLRIVVINIVSGIIMYIVVFYIVGPPIIFLLDSLTDYLYGIDRNNIILLVVILSLLTTVDLGGPFNKVAFAFMVELFLNGNYEIVGPVLISVTIPPLSIYVAMILYKNRFSIEDHEQKRFVLFSSLVGMTEGALAITFRRIKILPLIMLASLVGSLFAVLFAIESNLLLTSLAGIFGTSNILIYLLSHIVGVGFFVLLFPIVIKKNPGDYENNAKNDIIEIV